MKQVVYPSPFGDLILISLGKRLIYCNWKETDCLYKGDMVDEFYRHINIGHEDFSCLDRTRVQLDKYFTGILKVFSIPLLLKGSPFSQKVWKEMRKIPYGQTVSYGQLSGICNKPKAQRAVANACGRNPISIILPCHRVIASAGTLGGYTGGLDKKIALLKLEGHLLL